ncbi:MAG: hypothetical protein GC137_09540 [Alphaproteobacteria bacterium]|nr:hypothetical protein [Alphaproteobacteria bacterium]
MGNRFYFQVSNNDIGGWGDDRGGVAKQYFAQYVRCLHNAGGNFDKAESVWYGHGLGADFAMATRSYNALMANPNIEGILADNGLDIEAFKAEEDLQIQKDAEKAANAPAIAAPAITLG